MNKKNTYRVEELIEDSGFIDFILGSATPDVARQWELYIEENPTEESTIEEAKTFIQQLGGEDTVVDTADLDDVRQNLKSIVRADQQKPRSTRRMFVYAAAACMAFLLASVFLFRSNETIITAALEEQKSLNLSDGSIVRLNAESNLSYDAASYNKTNRILNLNGQAFFEVEKGKPFIVKTSSGQVEVLGTSFDIYDRNGLFIVGCKTGKVRVNAQTQSLTLLPGEEASLKDGKLIKSNKNIDEIGSWKQGLFYYEDIKLRVIFDEVERQYNTTITCQPTSLGDQPYTGYFTKNKLDSALTSICWPLRLKVEHKNDTIVVSKN